MPALTLTQAQIDNLLRTLASGISEVDVPGGQRIRYADPAALAKVLTDASVVEGTAEGTAGAFRTFATFYRDK